jgi:uncharacterized membrane protein YebE (DUF533 family)
MLCWLAAAAMAAPSAVTARSTGPAKTEVSKAVGKCIGLVAGGALLGALLGGRGNRGRGALIGGGVGGAACAVLMAAAKRQDKIIAAQRMAIQGNGEAAQYARFEDEDGREVVLASHVEQAAVREKVRPVAYEQDGTRLVSPELGEGTKDCRYASSEMTGASGTAKLPNQLFCRTPDGSWQPYAVAA